MTGRENGLFQRLPRVTVKIGDVLFYAMPETIEVKRRGELQTFCTVTGQSKVVYTGGGHRTVHGKGVLFGPDALQRYALLEGKFGEEDTLFLPECDAFPAVLSTLTVMGRNETAVWFSFVFEETGEVRVP